MNDMSQLASAMLVLVFAAVMLVVGQLYIENKSAKALTIPVAQGVASALNKSKWPI
jgi:hypothetical protein